MFLVHYVASDSELVGTALFAPDELPFMADPDHNESGLPDLDDSDDVIWFLDRNDVALPEGLTIEKIESRGQWWAIDDESFGFRIERHPSGLLFGGLGMPSPARWHVRKRYTYDLTTGEWDVTEQMREFHFDPGLLVDAEFEEEPKKHMWEQAIERAATADEPEDELEKRLDGIEEMNRSAFEDLPEDDLDEMLGVLADEFRRRAGMDERDSESSS